MEWIFEQLRRESELILKTPFAFVAFSLIGLMLGYAVATWYYNGRLVEKEGLVARYRVALGLDKPSQGNLIELTNEEMHAKAMTTVAALREFTISLRNQSDSAVTGARDEKEKAERSFRIMKEMSDEFDRKLKADTNLVDNELRRRLGPKAVASIVGVPPSIFSASDHAAVSIVGMMPSGMGMSAGFAGTLADGIEQMARLLPTH